MASAVAASAPQVSLELPTFKGKPGWEFTPIDKLDLAAFPAAPAGDDDSGAHLFAPAGAVTPTDEEPRESDPPAPIVAPLRVALERHAEVVGRHFGTVVRPSYFVNANADQWTDGTLVYVPRNVKVEAPIALSTVQAQAGTSLHHRTLIVLEEGAEAEVWDQVTSAHEDEAMVNGVVEIVVGDNATLRYIGAQSLNDRRISSRENGALPSWWG